MFITRFLIHGCIYGKTSTVFIAKISFHSYKGDCEPASSKSDEIRKYLICKLKPAGPYPQAPSCSVRVNCYIKDAVVDADRWLMRDDSTLIEFKMK